jgi:hypothetical protein
MIVAGVMSALRRTGLMWRSAGREPSVRQRGGSQRAELLGMRVCISAAVRGRFGDVAPHAGVVTWRGWSSWAELYRCSGGGKKLRVKAELVGCHGQTLYHRRPASF